MCSLQLYGKWAALKRLQTEMLQSFLDTKEPARGILFDIVLKDVQMVDRYYVTDIIPLANEALQTVEATRQMVEDLAELHQERYGSLCL